MTDQRPMKTERDEAATDYSDAPVLPQDVASAGRSCSVVLILLAAILLLVCVSLGFRWYSMP